MNIVINGKTYTLTMTMRCLSTSYGTAGLLAASSFAAAASVAPARYYLTASRWSAVSCLPRRRATG